MKEWIFIVFFIACSLAWSFLVCAFGVWLLSCAFGFAFTWGKALMVWIVFNFIFGGFFSVRRD